MGPRGISQKPGWWKEKGMKTFWRDLLGEEAADQLVAETHQMIEELGTDELRRMGERAANSTNESWSNRQGGIHLLMRDPETIAEWQEAVNAVSLLSMADALAAEREKRFIGEIVR